MIAELQTRARDLARQIVEADDPNEVLCGEFQSLMKALGYAQWFNDYNAVAQDDTIETALRYLDHRLPRFANGDAVVILTPCYEGEPYGIVQSVEGKFIRLTNGDYVLPKYLCHVGRESPAVAAVRLTYAVVRARVLRGVNDDGNPTMHKAMNARVVSVEENHGQWEGMFEDQYLVAVDTRFEHDNREYGAEYGLHRSNTLHCWQD